MNRIFFYLLIFFTFQLSVGQNKALDKKQLESLVELKKEMINDHELKSFYTIQLYSGRKDKAEQIKSDYDAKAFDYKAIIEYESPNYKVWVGRFRTKLEADKTYAKLKSDYPSSLIFKPGRG